MSGEPDLDGGALSAGSPKDAFQMQFGKTKPPRIEGPEEGLAEPLPLGAYERSERLGKKGRAIEAPTFKATIHRGEGPVGN